MEKPFATVDLRDDFEPNPSKYMSNPPTLDSPMLARNQRMTKFEIEKKLKDQDLKIRKLYNRAAPHYSHHYNGNFIFGEDVARFKVEASSREVP